MSIISHHNFDIFHCKSCNYKTKNKSDWKKHLLTKKHLKKTSGNLEEKVEPARFICENCGKEYKYRTGLAILGMSVLEKNK